MIGTILLNIILPIFIVIGLGVLVDRLFKPDLPTLSKLNFHVFVPALLLVKISETRIPLAALIQVGMFNAYLIVALGLIAFLVFSLEEFRKRRNLLTMGAIFFNAGNYGIPFILLAAGEKYMSFIAVTLFVQNLANFTLGLLMIQNVAVKPGQVIKACLRVPAIYAGFLALLLRALDIDLQVAAPFIYKPLDYLAQGLIPIALLTLGVQMSRNKASHNLPALSSVSTLRLVLSPVIAAGIAWAMGFSTEAIKVLTLIAGLPVAVNVYILSSEYRNDEEMASQMVFWTTLISALSLTGILLAWQYWPG